MNPALPPSKSVARLRRTLNLAGAILLTVGITASAAIWWAQDRADRQAGGEWTNVVDWLAPEDSARYTRQVEIYYGKIGVLTEKWLQGLGELGHGKPLAKLIAVTSCIAAGGLWVLSAGFRSSDLTGPEPSAEKPAPPDGR
jgi:hypothetical protein